jgi:hypothetical protein
MVYSRPKQRRRVTIGTQLGTLTIVGGSSLAQAASVIVGSGGGPTSLAFGTYAGQTGFVGVGPSGTPASPIYRTAGLSPLNQGAQANFDEIALAQSQGIVLFVTTSGSPSSFGANSAAGFDQAAYRNNLLTINSNATVRAAIMNQLPGLKVVCVAGDEPQHLKWTATAAGSPSASTWTPTLVNQCCRDHKKLWPGSITAMRIDANRLRFGYDGLTPPASGYDGLDYCMTQYEGPDLQASRSFTTMLANDRPHAAAINIDVIPTLNMWAAGVQTVSIGGVPACWDYQDTGSPPSSGIIAGSVQAALPGGSGLAQGQQVDCATWGAVVHKQTLACSPAQIIRVATEAAADPLIPWLPFWAYPVASLGLGWAATLTQRATYQAAINQAINICAARSSAAPLRTPKVALAGWPVWP